MSGSLRGWKVPPLDTKHPGWCVVVEAHNREDCREDTLDPGDPSSVAFGSVGNADSPAIKPLLSDEMNRRWSNTYLHVEQIKDPKMRLRLLRGQVASQLWSQRKALHDARRRRDEDLDAGYTPGGRLHMDRINAAKAAITALRLVADGLRGRD